MWFIDKRIQVICDELKKLCCVSSSPVENIQYKKDRFFYPAEADADEAPWEEFHQKVTRWYGPDEHYWFRAAYKVPESLDRKTLRLHVKTQIEEWDDGKNPQFLLFINGEAAQGLDMNHRTVQLDTHANARDVWNFDLQGYTGTLHTEFDLIMEVQQVDLRIEKLYYDLLVPLQAFSRMDADQ